jgi:hypothetical protein
LLQRYNERSGRFRTFVEISGATLLLPDSSGFRVPDQRTEISGSRAANSTDEFEVFPGTSFISCSDGFIERFSAFRFCL